MSMRTRIDFTKATCQSSQVVGTAVLADHPGIVGREERHRIVLLTGQVMSYDSRQKDWTVHFPPPMCFDHNYNYIGTYLNLRQAQGAVRRWKKGRVAVASEEYWLEEVRRIGAAFEAWEFVPK